MKFLRRVLALASLAVVVACDGEAPVAEQLSDLLRRDDETPTRQGQPGRGQGEEAPFAFQRTDVLEDAARPTLCLYFTKPLDPSVDYAPFVAIEASVAVVASGQSLCIEGLDYGDETQLTLLAGLPSADGDALPTDETVTLTFADRPPVVRFAGNGIVLPREDARGIPVQTINVDAVTVTVTRLNGRALAFRTITEGYTGAEGRYEWTPYDEQPGELGSAVFSGTLETPGPRNALVTTLLPIDASLGALEAGAYYVEISDARSVARGERQPARAGRWIVVTDLALTAYRGAGGLDVTVRSLETARPVPRATVRLIAQSNEILAEIEADADGRVRFDAPLLRGDGGDRPRLLTAERRNEDFAFLDLDRAPLDLSSHAVSGQAPRTGLEAFLYLDRGIYRPGETVHASALLRDAQGYAGDSQPGALVLYRPNGTEQARIRFDALDNAASLNHAFELPAAASRGSWRLAMELDALGEVGSIAFSVEDFVPQRLDLTVEADTGTPLGADEVRPITATLRFLYGAPGAGLRVSATARLQTDPSPFDGLADYRFGLHDDPFLDQLIDLPDATTDGAGVADLRLAIGDRGRTAPAPLRVRTVVRGEGPGGRAVQDDIIIPYRPRPLYLGLQPAFDRTAEEDAPLSFDLVAVAPDGTFRAAPVSWRLIRRDYDYDWYQDQGGRWQWRRSERVVLITEGRTETTAEGPTEITTPPLPWGDYAMIVSHGGEDLTSTGFWVGYGGRSADGTPAPDAVRVLTPDKPAVIGESVTVAIQPPYAGRAEVAVAHGSTLSLTHIDVDEGGAEVTLPVTQEWGAGAYVLVSVYTPREPGLAPVPRRAVGAAYLPTDHASRIFDVGLELPEVTRPGEPVTIGIDAGERAADEEVYATLAAVDEGILLLTKFASPDPAGDLFGKAALGVDIHDDYGRILDPDTGVVGALREGGDQIGGAGLTVVPTKSVALFRGPLALGTEGKTEVAIDLPDFNGQLRVMAVLWSKSSVGSASEALTVRDPVPAELILPRFLAPSDRAEATLTIDNVEGQAGPYMATIGSTSDAVSVADPVTEIALDRGERSDEPVTINGVSEGVTELTLRASGPGEFAAERSYPIEVRSAFMPETRSSSRVLLPGESYTPSADIFTGLEPGSASLLVSAAATPIDRTSLERALTRYPYGCTEQLVSQGTPLLLKPSRSAEETAQLRQIIETILERQGQSGAFGMWRVGDRLASPWLGAYTTDFLERAHRQGLPVPEAALTLAYGALQPISLGELARAYGYDSRVPPRQFTSDTDERLRERSIAYALYVLTRAGEVDRSRLRYVHDAQLGSIESPLARAQIGAALALLGDRGRAGNAFEKTLDVIGYENDGDWYQSAVRDRAGVIALLAESGRLDDALGQLAVLDRELPEISRMTTQEKAFLLRAADALSSGDGEAMFTHDGSSWNAVTLSDRDTLASPITNASDGPIYLTGLVTGTPSGQPPAASQGLTVTKALLSTSGAPVDPEAVIRGDRMIVALTITPADRQRKQLVVTDLLPAGLEIEAVLGPQDTGPSTVYDFLERVTGTDVAEARDDRFVASVIKSGGEPVRLAYLVRAVTPGSFVFPGAVAEDMYRAETFARSESGRLTVAP